jgi:hypothetical protein
VIVMCHLQVFLWLEEMHYTLSVNVHISRVDQPVLHKADLLYEPGCIIPCVRSNLRAENSLIR